MHRRPSRDRAEWIDAQLVVHLLEEHGAVGETREVVVFGTVAQFPLEARLTGAVGADSHHVGDPALLDHRHEGGLEDDVIDLDPGRHRLARVGRAQVSEDRVVVGVDLTSHTEVPTI